MLAAGCVAARAGPHRRRHATLASPGEGGPSMSACVRAGCDGEALAVWWRPGAECTRPPLEPVAARAEPALEQQAAAGWDAMDWAERIAPARWGNAVDDDPWVFGIRCLAFATVTTGRSQGC